MTCRLGRVGEGKIPERTRSHLYRHFARHRQDGGASPSHVSSMRSRRSACNICPCESDRKQGNKPTLSMVSRFFVPHCLARGKLLHGTAPLCDPHYRISAKTVDKFLWLFVRGQLVHMSLGFSFWWVIYSVHDVKGVVGPLSSLCPTAICYLLLISRFVERWQMKERKECDSHLDLMNR